MRLLVLIIVWPACVLAQEQAAPPPTESSAIAAPTTEARRFSQQELDQLLAPIALYPDALLAQVLMASTYPLEVVEANRWVKAHSYLMGDERQAALEEQNWDPSVKGLIIVPQVLSMMDEKLDWTEKLGDAFLAQQQDVMDTVQRLRAKAQAAGNLSSTPQQTVVTEGSTVSIQPANPEVIYVPVYNPAVIYGPWWWPVPPYYWYPPGYAAPGPFVYFGFGVVVGASIWGYCDWGHRTVIVNVPHYNTFNRTRITDPHWAHDVYHRRGVPYRDDALRREYRGDLPGADARRDFRGYETPRRFPEHPRPSDGQIRQELARPGTRPPPTPGGVQPPGIPRAVPAVPRAPPGVRPVPGAGDRLPGAPLPQRQPPGRGPTRASRSYPAASATRRRSRRGPPAASATWSRPTRASRASRSVSHPASANLCLMLLPRCVSHPVSGNASLLLLLGRVRRRAPSNACRPRSRRSIEARPRGAIRIEAPQAGGPRLMRLPPAAQGTRPPGGAAQGSRPPGGPPVAGLRAVDRKVAPGRLHAEDGARRADVGYMLQQARTRTRLRGK